MKRSAIFGLILAVSAVSVGCQDSVSEQSWTEASQFWLQSDTLFIPVSRPTDAKAMDRSSMWAADPYSKAVFIFSPGEERYRAIGADDREPLQIQRPAKLALSSQYGLAVYDGETGSVDQFTPTGEFIRGFELGFTPSVMEFSDGPVGYTFATTHNSLEGTRILIVRTDLFGGARDTLLSTDVGPEELRTALPSESLITASHQGLWVWAKSTASTIFEVAPRSSRTIEIRPEDQTAIGLFSDAARDILWLAHVVEGSGTYSAYDTRPGVESPYLGSRTTTGFFTPRVVYDGILMGWSPGKNGLVAAAFDLNADHFDREELTE